MKCESCGHELPEGAKFCLECGAPQAASASAADKPAREGADLPAQEADKGALVGDAGTDAETVSGAADAAAAAAEGDPALQPQPAPQPEPVEDDPGIQSTARLAARAGETVRPGETTPLEEALASLGRPDVDPVPVEETSVAPRVPLAEEPPVAEDKDAHRSARLGLLAAAVLFLAAVALLVGFVTWRMELWGGRTLPSVVGMGEQEAVAVLQDDGFSVTTKDVVTDDAVGKVVSQDPAGERRVDGGSVVTLGIGVERTVPEVEGLHVDKARELLKQGAIDHLRLEYQNSNEPEGTVVSVSPAAGSTVTADEVVTLVVAQPYTVPDVVGLEAADAEDAVTAAGLTPKSVFVASDKPSGTVVSTDPASGSTLKEGETVTVNVSSPYPTDPYLAAEYLATKPQDLSTYLRDRGYRLHYGTVADGVAETTWSGPDAAPGVVVGPNPFARYEGFQFWPTDALAAGAEMRGVRLTMTQASAPSSVGALRADQASVSKLMNACGLSSSPDTTTTAAPGTLVPEPGHEVEFAAKAGTMDGNTWAVVVYKDARGDMAADVCVAPTAELKDALKADGVDMAEYGDSMANVAASLLIGARR